MTIATVVDLLRCPRCAGDLQLAEQTLRCGRGHAYDLARQGYVNLLGRAAPANADTTAMVAARDRFLGTGAYAPLAAALVEQIRDSGLGPSETRVVVEPGAGTGYYLGRVLDALGGRGVALDVSVPAARRAARAHARVGSVVADTWQGLPVGDQTADLLLNVFAPRQPAEFARVLRPGGLVLTVTPRPEHLAEPRRAFGLLQVEDGKPARLAAALGQHFDAVGSTSHAATVVPDAAALADLVLMGPNGFHMERAELERQIAARTEPMTVTIAVTVGAWRLR